MAEPAGHEEIVATPPAGLSAPDAALWRAAVAVLERNWEQGWTVPSRRLYPHQWSWDSAFVAIGWARVAPGRARRELESLLDAQWSDGRVPQIVFNPATARDAYFPGPDFWGSRDIPEAAGHETSGLVQPPAHAAAAWLVHRADPVPGREFLRRVYPKLCAQHEYLLHARANATGLAVIVHPWESGLDNSPSWDVELAGVPVGAGGPQTVPGRRRDLDHAEPGERPTDLDYARYIALAERYREHGYRDADALPGHRFVVTDPLFNALLAWSEEALGRIARVIGGRARPHRRRAVALRDALLAHHFDSAAGTFVALGRDGRPGAPHSIGGIVPILLDLPPEIVDTLVRSAGGPRFALGDRMPLPSYDRTDPGFDATRYWRGPAWVNTSWLVLCGLERHGRRDEAAMLRAALVAAVRRSGFREYFDPIARTGHGCNDFSWTAALLLDVLARGPSGTPARGVSRRWRGSTRNAGRDRPTSG
ncbi:MAG: MGH1-like glycoside hydrolase domain-containing protein [Pseudonocardia sp.]